MNKGTKIRTIALAVTIINKVMVDIGTIDFGNEAVNVAYKVISTIMLIAASGFALYYNNDFTEAGCIGTGVTRQIKREQSEDYIGDRFFTDENGNLISSTEDVVEDEEDDIIFDDEEPILEEYDEQNDI